MSPVPSSPHRILLTGANGYIATHILSQLLASPSRHSIRAVVRSQSKVDALKALFPNTSLDFAVVPDMTVYHAFDAALKPDNGAFDIVMHTASPFLFSAAKNAQDFLGPAIKGTIEILEAIERIAKHSVKRVIVTSSHAAVGGFGLIDEKNKIYTEDDWNPMTLTMAEEAFDKGNKGPAYLVSKTLAERAAWDFHAKLQKEGHPTWDLITLCPPMVYGPIANKVNSLEGLGESVAQIYSGYLGSRFSSDALPPQDIPLYVDVRDLALAHVRAMDAPDAGNQRFNICAGDIRSQDIADILRKEVEGVEGRVPKGEPGKDMKPADAYSVDSSKAERVLGLVWRGKGETIGDMGRQFVELEGRFGGEKSVI